MMIQSLYRTYNRYRTLQTDKISSLPIVILMPHSSCNCRCVMCDIWKGNQQLKQLNETDIRSLLGTLKKFQTQRVVMSGGEALLNPNFFRFCEILKARKIKISLLSTGLTIRKNASQLVKWVDDVIVSIDGDGALHDEIRNVPGVYAKLKEGIAALKSIHPGFRVTGRTVIHRLNFRHWPAIVDSAKEIGLDRISFLPADVSSHAFNREIAWDEQRQHEILPREDELNELQAMIYQVIAGYSNDFMTGFIAESPGKIQMIHDHYAAYYDHCEFPYKKCNAPWVSTVIEADGTVRPCFFHPAIGNIKAAPLDAIVNSAAAIAFRKNLDTNENETCKKCVCYLNLSPGKNPGL